MSGEVKFGDRFQALELVKNSQEYQDAIGLPGKVILVKLQVNDYFLEDNIPDKKSFKKQRGELDQQFDALWIANRKAAELFESFKIVSETIKTENIQEVAPFLDDLAYLDPELHKEVVDELSIGFKLREDVVNWVEKLSSSDNYQSILKVEILWHCFCAIVDSDALQTEVFEKYQTIKIEPNLSKEIDEAYRAREFPKKPAISQEEKQQVKEEVEWEKRKFEQSLEKIETALQAICRLLEEISRNRKEIEDKFREKDLEILTNQDKETIEEAFSTRVKNWNALEAEVKERIQKIERFSQDALYSMSYFNKIVSNGGLPISNVMRFATLFGK